MHHQGLNVINVGQRPENLSDLIDKSGAACLVDGQIRIAGNSLRATVKLVDASSGTTLWTQTLIEKTMHLTFLRFKTILLKTLWMPL